MHDALASRVVPTFCRHNRLIQNCPICAREQAVEMRPVVTSSAPRTAQPRPGTPSAARSRSSAASSSRAGGSGGVVVRRVARGADDGYRNPLVLGLKSSFDAGRLAEEIAFAEHRLRVLEQAPPGLYREVADTAGDPEDRSWLAFLIAYLCPLEEEDPFAEIARVRTSWASGEIPNLDEVRTGPRTAHDPGRGGRTLEAYRTWAARAGSQAAAFTGDAAWAPERRFARAYERLALPGLHRDARFDLLVTLGRLGVYDLRAGSLALGGSGDVTVGAKRALGIGDPLLLERRASDLAQACGVPVEALDLGLHNWQRAERATLGLGPGAEPDPETLGSVHAALGL
jgi:Alpha-glutamyl/putrescinyl thymine pyrophosphorylase clade 3